MNTSYTNNSENKKKFYDSSDIDRNNVYLVKNFNDKNLDNDLRFGVNSGENRIVMNDTQNDVNNILDNQFNLLSKMNVNTEIYSEKKPEIGMGYKVEKVADYTKRNNADNTKRHNLDFSFYYAPSNMSNTGFTKDYVYDEITYPKTTRKLEDDISLREVSYNRIEQNNIYDNFGLGLDIYKNRAGIDTRSDNKKLRNN
jgi:hypothetical protein